MTRDGRKYFPFDGFIAAMAKLKTERHHWWPKAVSANWCNDQGNINRLSLDGTVLGLTPVNCGVIGNAHHIKAGRTPGEETIWDSSFESTFQNADDRFPAVISWMNSLERRSVTHSHKLAYERFFPIDVSDDELFILTECILSLAIRSPMSRESSVSLAEDIRGPLTQRERNLIISVSLMHSLKTATRLIGTRGKYVVLFSPDRELIYGDGFFHNILSPVDVIVTPKILVPITPRIAVLFARPTMYVIEPRFCTLVLNSEEAELFNRTIQIYSKEYVFFRFEKPKIDAKFSQGSHMIYASLDNPVDNLIYSVPGVLPRDRHPFGALIP